MFELCEIDVGGMLNITKSLQGKETHGLRILHFNSQYTLARKFTQTQIHTQRERHTSV